MPITLYTARHVFPVSAEPIADGAVATEDGRIVAVGAAADLRDRFPSAKVVDLGERALLPGLVNAHTHLELTHHAGHVPDDLPLIEWIGPLVRYSRTLHTRRLRARGVCGRRDDGCQWHGGRRRDMHVRPERAPADRERPLWRRLLRATQPRPHPDARPVTQRPACRSTAGAASIRRTASALASRRTRRSPSPPSYCAPSRSGAAPRTCRSRSTPPSRPPRHSFCATPLAR